MSQIHQVPFYHGTTRRLTAAFGTIFNNLMVERRAADGTLENSFRVPLGYASKQHWKHRLEDDKDPRPVSEEGDQAPGSKKKDIALVLPRISYFMTGMTYNSSRQMNPLSKIKREVQIAGQHKTRKWSYMPVPMIFNYEVSVIASNVEDGLQIVEQFVPYFNPMVNLRILEIPELQVYNDVKVSMSTQDFTDTYEAGFSERRTLIWTFGFEVQANLYPPVREQKVILTSIVDIDNFAPLYNLEIITVAANPGELSDPENSTTTIQIDT